MKSSTRIEAQRLACGETEVQVLESFVERAEKKKDERVVSKEDKQPTWNATIKLKHR